MAYVEQWAGERGSQMIALATRRAAMMFDISARCGIMLGKVIKLQIPTELAHLSHRHEAVNARPMAQA